MDVHFSERNRGIIYEKIKSKHENNIDIAEKNIKKMMIRNEDANDGMKTDPH